MQKRKNAHKKNKQGFSLVETLITIAIFAIIMAMVTQIIMLNMRASIEITQRTRVREELATLTGLIKRDLRNSSSINSCGYITINGDVYGKGCRMTISQENNTTFTAKNYLWVYRTNGNPFAGEYNNCIVNNNICKFDETSTAELIYKSGDIVKFDLPSFTVSPQHDKVLITLSADATNAAWKITDQVRQISVSTRNYSD